MSATNVPIGRLVAKKVAANRAAAARGVQGAGCTDGAGPPLTEVPAVLDEPLQQGRQASEKQRVEDQRGEDSTGFAGLA